MPTPTTPTDLKVTGAPRIVNSAAGDDTRRRAKLDKWPTILVHRSQIELATYNPRKIDRVSKEKLHDLMKAHGIASTLTLNRRSAAKGFDERNTLVGDEILFVGTLVGGHQRINEIDESEKDQNYWVNVTMVDVNLTQEKAMNIALNNPAAQGEFDPDGLADLIRDTPDLDLSSTGFSPMDLEVALDAPGNEDVFELVRQNAATQEAVKDAEKLAKLPIEKREAKAAEMQAKREAKEAKKAQPLSEEDIQKIKESKRAHKESKRAADDTEFITIVVFRDRNQQSLFMQTIGSAAEERYADGAMVLRIMGIDESTESDLNAALSEAEAEADESPSGDESSSIDDSPSDDSSPDDSPSDDDSSSA